MGTFRRFACCAAWCLFLLPVLPVAAGEPAPLPEGNNGIAAAYPNDTGIQAHADVIFADDFESYASASQLTTKWDQTYHATNTRIATETANVFAGGKSLEFKVPIQTTETSNTVIKFVNPKLDTLFVRCYTKFDAGYDIHSSNHNGTGIFANYSGPGIPANGTNKFYVGLENSGNAPETSPGPTHLYVYHPEQRSQWGDHFFPDGRVLPFDYLPGDYGPYFVKRPNFTPLLNKWYCVELMVKANTPGQRDGRIAYWIDGKLAADFLNIRLRDVDTLKIDKFDLSLHINGTTTRVNYKWYDNVVAAKSYIGPMTTGTPPPANLAPEIDSGGIVATPDPVVNRNSTQLAVTATDPDNGPQPLKYDWSKSAGPGTVTFTPDNTTASDITTAVFSASGTYTLKVTVSDSDKTASDTRTLSVTLPTATPPPVIPPTGSKPSVRKGGCSVAAGPGNGWTILCLCTAMLSLCFLLRHPRLQPHRRNNATISVR